MSTRQRVQEGRVRRTVVAVVMAAFTVGAILTLLYSLAAPQSK